VARAVNTWAEEARIPGLKTWLVEEEEEGWRDGEARRSMRSNGGAPVRRRSYSIPNRRKQTARQYRQVAPRLIRRDRPAWLA